MAYDARTIANVFLELGSRDGAHISPLKMQKLVYLANGWSLLAPVSAQALPRLVEITDTNALISARFYRVTTP